MAGIFRKTPKEKLPETVESSLLACLFGFSSNAHWLVSRRVCGSSFLHELFLLQAQQADSDGEDAEEAEKKSTELTTVGSWIHFFLQFSETEASLINTI